MNISDEKRVLKAVDRLEKEWAITDAKTKKKIKPGKPPKKKRDLTPIEIKTAKKEKIVKEADKKRLADNQEKIAATKD